MSNINTENINGAYPIAGQDNDSQGFRDNFTNIKNNFALARSEITDLENKAVLKSSLSGSTLNNDMAGSLLSSATIRDFREIRFDLSEVQGEVTVNHANGHYQTMSLLGDVSLRFTGFPGNTLGRIRVEIQVNSTTHRVNLPPEVTLGTDGIIGLVITETSRVISYNQTGTYVYEFTSRNGGSIISIEESFRARNYISSPTLKLETYTPSATGAEGHTAGMIAVSEGSLHICDAEHDGATNIWKPIKAGTESYSLSTTWPVTSSTLVDVPLGFTTQAGRIYRFDALLPFRHTATESSTHTFGVFFESGTCNYLVEQQSSPTSSFSAYSGSESNSASSVVTTESNQMRFARITGTYTNEESSPVFIRAATSDGLLEILAGASISVQVVN
jgi:hypothetical protein